MKFFYVYIVLCADGSYYTGMTNDVDRRLLEHNSGINVKAYTFKRRPVKLVFHEQFIDFYSAEAFEKQIKGWSRRKKEALINGEYQELIRLSKNYTKHGKPQ